MCVCGLSGYSADAATTRRRNVLIGRRSLQTYELQLAVKRKKMFAHLRFVTGTEVDFFFEGDSTQSLF